MNGYGARVHMLIARLLAIAAMLLMPLVMASAPAAASHHAMAADLDMRHCPAPAPDQKLKGGIAVCTMACASALPALDAEPAELVAPAEAPPARLTEQKLDGLHPETATPPPKLG